MIYGFIQGKTHGLVIRCFGCNFLFNLFEDTANEGTVKENNGAQQLLLHLPSWPSDSSGAEEI